jgi:hypothetical protein
MESAYLNTTAIEKYIEAHGGRHEGSFDITTRGKANRSTSTATRSPARSTMPRAAARA